MCTFSFVVKFVFTNHSQTLGGLEEQLSRVEKDLEALTTQIPRVQLSIQILEILASRTKEAETMIRMLELDMRVPLCFMASGQDELWDKRFCTVSDIRCLVETRDCSS